MLNIVLILPPRAFVSTQVNLYKLGEQFKNDKYVLTSFSPVFGKSGGVGVTKIWSVFSNLGPFISQCLST